MEPEKDLLGKTLYTAQESCKMVLSKIRIIPPCAWTFGRTGDHPKVYYPHDTMRDAGWQELLDAAVRHLETRISTGEVGSIALATTLVSGNDSALALQVETEHYALMWFYPYVGEGAARTLAEGGEAKNLLIEPRLMGIRPRMH